MLTDNVLPRMALHSADKDDHMMLDQEYRYNLTGELL